MEVLLRGHGGDGGATAVLVRCHGGDGGAAATPLRIGPTRGVLKLSFQTCVVLNKHMCFSRLHILYVIHYAFYIRRQTHML